MKKVSLAIILALSTAGVAFLANAETDNKKPQDFGDLTKSASGDKVDNPRLEKNVNKFERKDNREHRERRWADRGMPEQCGRFMPMYHMQGRGMMMPMMADVEPEIGFGGPKGITGGFVVSKDPVKVSGSDKWEDDAFVVLEGNIIKQVGKKDFVFKDDSGELTLEIDRKAWRGEVISPKDKVKIIANVDKSFGKLEVEALAVENLDKPKMPLLPKAGDKVSDGKPVQSGQKTPEVADMKPAQ
ncbi:NirD/YgiW/YdeI family stress tolerance protein [Pasteurellaceae bacterium LIM206]|nr:NirD/YgiW/YdeI family stress tolerance protein [Pasteurellaceae bacterium LIM206]